MGYLSAQALRAARIVVDIGMHLGYQDFDGNVWNAQSGKALLSNQALLDDAHSTSEIDRYLGWPGQAISYKVGERVWMKTREDAKARLGANFGYGYSCALWPVKPATKIDVTGKGAGPIIVIGTTGDAATPLASTRKMAAALEQGILLIVEANQHTGYGINDCINTAVDSYLINLTVPVSETTCKS
jgi:hypothetical protein